MVEPDSGMPMQHSRPRLAPAALGVEEIVPIALLTYVTGGCHQTGMLRPGGVAIDCKGWTYHIYTQCKGLWQPVVMVSG